MPSLAQFASRDETKPLKVVIGSTEINLVYWPNRINTATMEVILPADSDIDLDKLTLEEYNSLKYSSRLPECVESWDVTGPLLKPWGEQVINLETGLPFGEHDIIPLDPRYCMWIPSPITTKIITQINEDISPNGRQSQLGPKRLKIVR